MTISVIYSLFNRFFTCYNNACSYVIRLTVFSILNIITDKNTDILLGYDLELDYQSNGYPRLVNLDIAFVKDNVFVFEIDELPEYVVLGKYCYTEADGFYVDPNYVEPDPTNIYNIPDETYHAIIDDYTSSITEEVANNGY